MDLAKKAARFSYQMGVVALGVAISAGSLRGEDKPLYLDASLPIGKRVDDLLSRLTIEEKISLLHGDSKFTTAAIPRLGIPRRWLSDGPHGVREDVGPDTWNPAGRTDDFCTAMPCDLLLAATWEPHLARSYGEVIGQEARARGKQIMLGPSVCIQRTPLCGRNFEYMGEDPFLTSRIAVGYIQGRRRRGFHRASSTSPATIRRRTVERSMLKWMNARCGKFICRRSGPRCRKGACFQ